jgi:hypothetical protein
VFYTFEHFAGALAGEVGLWSDCGRTVVGNEVASRTPKGEMSKGVRELNYKYYINF